MFSVFQLVGKLKCTVRLLRLREKEFFGDAVVVRHAIDVAATEERFDALLLLGRNGCKYTTFSTLFQIFLLKRQVR